MADLKLRNAQRIIFCGYSFPEADLQIRYLLKRIQINRKQSPNSFEIHVVNGKRREDETKNDWIKRKRWEKMRFETFFGKDVVTYHEMDFEIFVKNPI